LAEGISILENSLLLLLSKPKKYDTIAQGFFGLKFRLAKILYIIYINSTVATTETKEPKLDTAFQPL
jgi:hypothetical protein